MKMLLILLLFIHTLIQSSSQKVSKELANFYKHFESIVELKGGDFKMGIADKNGINNEYPQRLAKIKPIRIMQYPVTVASFQKFKLEKTRYRTYSEEHESSWCFKNLTNSKAMVDIFQSPTDPDSQEARKQHMKLIHYAQWSKPFGGTSGMYNYLDYPVVHVSYHDAFAYCSWKRMRLPNEMEWEFAARGGLVANPYPWGEVWELNRTNLWQGTFPVENQVRDRFYGLSPVDAYKAQNNYEMYDMLGNVWEWTSTMYKTLEHTRENQRRVLKGGSFLDLRDGLHTSKDGEKLKVRISARIGRGEHFTAQNIGFRCVQPIREHEPEYKFKEDETHRVHKFRQPKIFGHTPEDTRFIVEKHEKIDKDEL